jgi:hypothetical protein
VLLLLLLLLFSLAGSGYVNFALGQKGTKLHALQVK